MNSNNFKYIFFIITIIFGLESIAWSKINSQIIFKINNEIITNIDIENEKKFLQFLNPKLKNLSNQKIESISINSIKNRVIKEIELRKYFELNDSSLGMKYVQRFVSKSNYTNIENLMNELSMKELNYKVKHGDAVSVGLLMAIRLSVLLKKTKYNNYNLIKSHLNKVNLPTSLNCLNSKKKWNTKNLIKNMQSDKKRVDKNIKFILLNDIGKAYVENHVSYEKINLTINEFF